MNWKETYYNKFKKGNKIRLIEPCRNNCKDCNKIIRDKIIGKINFEYSDNPNNFHVTFGSNTFDCKDKQLKHI